MTNPELNSLDLLSGIASCIEANITAETAYLNFTDGLTVEAAEFCLRAVSDQVLAIDFKRLQIPHVYDEKAIIFEAQTRTMMHKFSKVLIRLITEEELSHGASHQDAKSAAHTCHGEIFLEYIDRRRTIQTSTPSEHTLPQK